MKVSCDVIKDILPLYAEGMVSEDSRKLVESHIAQCDDCTATYDKLRNEIKIPAEPETLGLLRVKSAIRKKRWRTVLQVVFAILFIPLFLFSILIVPVSIPAEDAIENVYVDENGTLAYKFREGTYHFDVYTHKASGEAKDTKHIVVYENLYTWLYQLERPNDPGGYLVDTTTKTPIITERVLYGYENVCLWGNPVHSDIHLECLAVAAAMLMAISLAVIHTVQYRKGSNDQKKDKYLKRSIFFWSYVLMNLLILKFDLRVYGIMFSWTSLTYFGAILVLTLLLYGFVTLAIENRSIDI